MALLNVAAQGVQDHGVARHELAGAPPWWKEAMSTEREKTAEDVKARLAAIFGHHQQHDMRKLDRETERCDCVAPGHLALYTPPPMSLCRESGLSSNVGAT